MKVEWHGIMIKKNSDRKGLKDGKRKTFCFNPINKCRIDIDLPGD